MSVRPRLALAAGVTGVLLGTLVALLWWAPLTQSVVLLPAVLLCALVAFAHGAWRLAATGLCLGLSVLAAVVAEAGSAILAWQGVLPFVPLAVSLGLATWLGIDYARKKGSAAVHRLPAWLEASRSKLGMGVGALSLATALGSLASAWPMLVPLWPLAGPQTVAHFHSVSTIAASSFLLGPLALLGALTAWACAAWRLAMLTAFLSLPSLVLLGGGLFAGSAVYHLLQLAWPLLGAAALAASLIASYRRSKSNTGVPDG